MFTGIVQSVGRVRAIEPREGDIRVSVDSGDLDLSDMRPGDSIALSGVCLTAIVVNATSFCADVSVETLSRTTLGRMTVGSRVNLEKPLRLADRIGGHLVSGHVDGLGELLAIQADARSQRWKLALPDELSRYVAAKGSICIDGVSLTVNEVAGSRFGVNLIPHTLGVTTFSERNVGDHMNVEVDLIARYVERLHASD